MTVCGIVLPPDDEFRQYSCCITDPSVRPYIDCGDSPHSGSVMRKYFVCNAPTQSTDHLLEWPGIMEALPPMPSSRNAWILHINVAVPIVIMFKAAKKIRSQELWLYRWFMLYCFCCDWVIGWFYPYPSGLFTGTVTIIPLPQCQWSNPKEYE